MENTLKVGQRIDVYRVLTDGGYSGEQFTVGSYRAGHIVAGLVETLPNKGKILHTLPMENHTEVKKVGTLVIKSLKGETTNV